MEVVPPVARWDKIEEQLDSTISAVKKETPVVPFNKRLSKYAAAAAVVGILALAAYFLAQRSSQDVDVIQKSFADNTSLKIPEQPVINTQPQNKIKAVPVANAKDSAKHSAPLMIIPSDSDGVVTTSNGNSYTTTVEKNREVDGRYIVLMTEDGNVVRMNKKVSGLADCIAGDDPSQQCNNQIEEWQKELVSMPVLSSPDNILGILELANRPVAGL